MVPSVRERSARMRRWEDRAHLHKGRCTATSGNMTRHAIGTTDSNRGAVLKAKAKSVVNRTQLQRGVPRLGP
jgi:hypothetical protein